MMPIVEQHTSRVASLQNRKGFTLLEIIVTLILISITGVVMFPVLRTNLTQSATPVTRVDSQYQLVQEMDRLTARYRDEIQDDLLDINPLNINDLKTYIDNNTPFGTVTATTDLLSPGDITGSNGYSSKSDTILRVTLVDGDQRLVSFFTE